MKLVNFKLVTFFFFIICFVFAQLAHAAFDEKISEMISAYAKSSEGVHGKAFKEKVNEIDNELREKLEKDSDIRPFQELLKAAESMNARKSARTMFEVVLQKAVKRLRFSKSQQEIKDPQVIESVDEILNKIEKYLDPNKPDDDTVDREKLETKRKQLKEKINKIKASLLKIDDSKRYSVQIVDETGAPGKLPPAEENNLIEKLKVLLPEPEKLSVTVKLKPNKLFDMHVAIKNFVSKSGFAMIEGELDFVDIALEALKNSNPSESEGILDDNHFQHYRVVQDEEQLNIMPHPGNTAYEMGSLMTGQVYNMEFKKTSGISAIVKELENNDQVVVLNGPKAANEKMIKLKNVGSKDLIYLQGTDYTGLVSVKAIGGLYANKDGHVAFKETLLVVDDQPASDLTKFVGEQGINFFLKLASENMRKGMPFTPILEHLNFDRNPEGKQVYIFSGRGKNNTN